MLIISTALLVWHFFFPNDAPRQQLPWVGASLLMANALYVPMEQSFLLEAFWPWEWSWLLTVVPLLALVVMQRVLLGARPIHPFWPHLLGALIGLMLQLWYVNLMCFLHFCFFRSG